MVCLKDILSSRSGFNSACGPARIFKVRPRFPVNTCKPARHPHLQSLNFWNSPHSWNPPTGHLPWVDLFQFDIQRKPICNRVETAKSIR